MKALFYSRDRCPKGAALIIVLTFVVLLTGLVLAYFSRATTDGKLAQSSLNDTKSDLFARNVLDILVADLKQEIIAGSTVSTDINGQNAIYIPTSNSNMLPVRSGNPGSVTNLVRRSIRLDPIPPPGLPSRASALNSTLDVSANGRSVSSTRWNSHYLVPKKNAGTDDSLPIDAFTAATPDWVFVTNAGPLVITAPSASVIGRYGYAIYDEGGLIDVNVKGYPMPTSSPAAYVQAIGRKGSGVFADLSQLTGMSNTSINNLIGWRNYASARPNGNLTSGFSFDPTSATNFVNYVLGNSNGFLSTSGQTWTGGGGSGTDQAFISRQELIKFRAIASAGLSFVNALQYLGTFSREINAPSWRPTQDASEMGGNNGPGNIYAYRTNADSNTAINRNLLGVRVTNPFTRSNGTQAIVGEPLLKTRFPLTRVNELADTSNPYIQRDFGLKWNAAQNHWDYVGATGSTVQSAIERLDQVTSENREPNFFELLKAVILNGSVGLGSGAQAASTFVISEPKYYNTAGNLSADYQILQIGANIIDAWDANNIPSFVYFADNELAGMENLPYLSKIVYDFWLSNHGNNGDHDEWSAWLVPSLWNPHQNAALAPSGQDVRLVMTSGSVTGWLVLDGNRGTYQTPTIASTGTTPFVEIKANQFAAPYPPSPSNENGSPPHSSEIGAVTEGPCNPSCYDGIALADHVTTEKQAYKHVNKAYPTFAAGTTFQMQIQINGSWKAYQSWNGCANGTTTPTVYSPGKNKFGNLEDPEFVSLDPRTVRFGVWANDGGGSGNDDDITTGLELTMDENNGGNTPEIVTAMKPQPAGAFPTTGKTYLYSTNGTTGDQYADLDGVKRRGDWTTDLNGIGNTKTIMYPANLADRPQILASPFQSITELGQIFRDQPWKTLNFTTGNSGDVGLLDVFTMQDLQVPIMAGRTSLNTRQMPVLKAILSQVALKLDGTSILSSSQVTALATDIAAITNATPLINKADLLAQLVTKSSFTTLGNKEARECVMRAFSDACQARTWNLLIDVIAQSGRYAPGETDLRKFVVQGEQRYWMHLAIDRFTGQVVDKQLEVVNE